MLPLPVLPLRWIGRPAYQLAGRRGFEYVGASFRAWLKQGVLMRSPVLVELQVRGLLYLRVERIPGWLGSILAAALSSIGTWWWLDPPIGDTVRAFDRPSRAATHRTADRPGKAASWVAARRLVIVDHDLR